MIDISEPVNGKKKNGDEDPQAEKTYAADRRHARERSEEAHSAAKEDEAREERESEDEDAETEEEKAIRETLLRLHLPVDEPESSPAGNEPEL